jgi:hypothetical protein
MSNDDPFAGPNETVLRHNGADVPITLDDAKSMRESLLEYLKKSDIGDKDQLIAATKYIPGWIDSDGKVRPGGWLLQSRGTDWVLTYRLSQNELRAYGYAAIVTKGAPGWKVTKIESQMILFRR